MPTELIGVSGTQFDFTAGAPLADRDLDNAFTGIEVGDDGLSWSTLWGPGGADATSMWWVRRRLRLVPGVYGRRVLARAGAVAASRWSR